MDNKTNVVSVIVPVYNVDYYIEKCINSICNQTYYDLQIILVDDGSTDRSGIICDTYAKKDKRIKVIHQENKGLVNARKTGIKYAFGFYTMYVDSDDWIEINYIENMVRSIKKDKSDIVCANHIVENDNFFIEQKNSISAGVFEKNQIITKSMYSGVFYKFGITQYVWSKIFITSILIDVQMLVPDNISLGEDVALIYNYLLRVKKISIIDYSGYHYFQRSNSIIRTEYYNHSSLINFLKKTLLSNNNGDVYSYQLNQYIKLVQLTERIFDKNGPYGDISNSKNVIVYGAGITGQRIVHKLINNNINVIAWLDKAYNKINNFKQELILNPESFIYSDYMFDFVIIAITNEDICNEVVELLYKLGVDKSKVRKISKEYIDKWVLN